MQNIGTTLQPNVALPFYMKGTVFQILSSGNSAGLTIQILQGGRVAYTVNGALTGWKIKPQGGFDSLTIMSATGDTISGIVTSGDLDVQVLESIAEVTNTSANPLPVYLPGNSAGNPLAVTLEGSTVNLTATNVGINNTSANPVPVTLVSEPGAPFQVQPVPSSSAATDIAPLAVTVAGVELIAAGTRKGLRIRNSGTGQLGLTAASATTFAQAAIVLQPGDMWNETDAPQATWYAISDVGTTANMQAVA